MPPSARYEIVDADRVGSYHCMIRCADGAYLDGTHPESGRDCGPRVEWIRSRLQFLAAHMAVDVLGYGVLPKQLHVLLRNRPDLVGSLSPSEVARRWLSLHPGHRDEAAPPVEPDRDDVRALVADKPRIADLRERLSNLSWFMRNLSEPISRRANRQDEVVGAFWTSRFSSQSLLDDFALLAALAYVELNPVRAGLVTTAAKCKATSLNERFAAQRQQNRAGSDGKSASAADPSRLPDRWLVPIQREAEARRGRGRPRNPTLSLSPYRASDLGILEISRADYLELVTWTAKQLRADRVTDAPPSVRETLDTYELDAPTWVGVIRGFPEIFRRAAGTRESLEKADVRWGRNWQTHASRAAERGYLIPE